MITSTLSNNEHKRIHPHQFTLWVAIASILMMFAGLTSAFIVKSNLTGWVSLKIPSIFWVSTATIVLSSITIQLAVAAFKMRSMSRYRSFMWITFILGVLFVAFQIIGFREMWESNIRFRGASGAGQFFYAIVGLHALHIAGGLVALLIMLIRSYVGKTKVYSVMPTVILSSYWHFVDLLWLYLIVFFLIIG